MTRTNRENLKKELEKIRRKRRSPHKPTIRHKDKTKYDRKKQKQKDKKDLE